METNGQTLSSLRRLDKNGNSQGAKKSKPFPSSPLTDDDDSKKKAVSKGSPISGAITPTNTPCFGTFLLIGT